MIQSLTREIVHDAGHSVGQSYHVAEDRARDSTRRRSLPFEWTKILGQDAGRWESYRVATKGGPKILMASAYGLDVTVADLEAMLAVALTLRGAEVHFLVCDEALPACWISQIDLTEAKEFIDSGPSRSLCDKCFEPGYKVIQSLGLPTHRYSELIASEELRKARDLSSSLSVSELKEYRLNDLVVGEHALAGALRFYARGDLKGEPDGEAVLRRYFNAALLTVFATRRLLNTLSFACVSTLHGIYVPEGLIGEVAREQGVRIAAWCAGYRNRTFVFSHYDTYHHTLLSEPTAAWENLSWTPEVETEIVNYLDSRRYGTRDWIRYIEQPQEDVARIASEIGIDFTKPCVSLLTNVVWDAQLHFRGNAFNNMVEWVLETIRYFAKRADLQLIIRVHPGELLGKTRARHTIIEEIRLAFPTLPANVFVIPPESAISTYTLAAQCNATVIYATKAGMELAAMGMPVIVAGEAWIRNKGVSLDANTPLEYFKLLDQLPLKESLGKEHTQRARKYAYHYFFRRLIPLPVTVPGAGSQREPDLNQIDDLLPGRHAGLDVVCDGILKGSEFIYPAELYSRTAEDTRQVSKESLAKQSLRTVAMLGKLGELERMRSHLIKSLQEFPWMITESWARGQIAWSVSRLATASDNPIGAVRVSWREVEALYRGGGSGQRLSVRGAFAVVWTETAIGLWKRRSYRWAICAAGYAVFQDPKQFIQRVLSARLVPFFARAYGSLRPVIGKQVESS